MAPAVFLSILIPVYNWDARELLIRLAAQAEGLGGDEVVEIIVIDDASSVKFSNKETAGKIARITYRELTKNIGRAAIRNKLLQEASGEYVLFLDADMLPDCDDFLQRYVSEAKEGKEILCGGISYLQCERDDKQYSFYLYKSGKTESLSAPTRQKAPWRYLFTSNILLLRKVMESVSFDSRFSGYGFEDIEWGIRLSRSHTIRHIDNSCSHMGLMRKSEVYSKMCESISNYGLLIALHPQCSIGMGAGALASRLSFLPHFILQFLNNLFSFLFHRLNWNKLLFLLFQLNKAVLLAIMLKKNSKKHPNSKEL